VFETLHVIDGYKQRYLFNTLKRKRILVAKWGTAKKNFKKLNEIISLKIAEYRIDVSKATYCSEKKNN
jgi:hypothetical protein